MVRDRISQNSGSDQRIDHSLQTRACRLYKVLIDQRRANPEAFTPLLFSFGPYHAFLLRSTGNNIDVAPSIDNIESVLRYVQDDQYGAHLLEGHQLKLSTARGLLAPNARTRFENLVNEIKEHAEEIHAQYKQLPRHQMNTPQNLRNLATVLALDAIMIVAATLSLERLRLCATTLIFPFTRIVLSDAILLENQVPIRVLQIALASIKSAEGEVSSSTENDDEELKAVIGWYCKRASPFRDRSPKLEELAIGMHRSLLAFLYDYVTTFISGDLDLTATISSPARAASLAYKPSLRTASHLARCGLRFVPASNAMDQFSISFDSRRAMALTLPRITVNETTLRVLHNLLAYEATDRLPQQYLLISYVHFMDCLIDTAHDAQILINAGIICNELGSVEELASKWNRLCISVSYKHTPSDEVVMAQLEALSKQKWRRWRASFIELYWERQPWLLISLIAATILLVLALLQTVFSILAYYTPSA